MKMCSNWGMGLKEKDPHDKLNDFTDIRQWVFFQWVFLKIVFGCIFKKTLSSLFIKCILVVNMNIVNLPYLTSSSEK